MIVVSDFDDLVDGATNVAFTAANRTKLAAAVTNDGDQTINGNFTVTGTTEIRGGLIFEAGDDWTFGTKINAAESLVFYDRVGNSTAEFQYSLEEASFTIRQTGSPASYASMTLGGYSVNSDNDQAYVYVNEIGISDGTNNAIINAAEGLTARLVDFTAYYRADSLEIDGPNGYVYLSPTASPEGAPDIVVQDNPNDGESRLSGMRLQLHDGDNFITAADSNMRFNTGGDFYFGENSEVNVGRLFVGGPLNVDNTANSGVGVTIGSASTVIDSTSSTGGFTHFKFRTIGTGNGSGAKNVIAIHNAADTQVASWSTTGQINATNIGVGAGANSTFVGLGATSPAIRGVAIGYNAVAGSSTSDSESTAIGTQSSATGTSTAIGKAASASGGGVAIGVGTTATGRATAIQNATVSANDGIGIGAGSTVASGHTGGIAIGRLAATSIRGDIVIGSGEETATQFYTTGASSTGARLFGGTKFGWLTSTDASRRAYADTVVFDATAARRTIRSITDGTSGWPLLTLNSTAPVDADMPNSSTVIYGTGTATSIKTKDSAGTVTSGSLARLDQAAVFASTITATAGGFSGAITSTRDAIAVTPTDGHVHANTTAATLAVPVQMSPRSSWSGSAWKSTATAASQSHVWTSDVLPVTGTTSTSSTWRLGVSNNGGAYTYPFFINSDGTGQLGPSITILDTGGTLRANTFNGTGFTTSSGSSTVTISGARSAAVGVQMTFPSQVSYTTGAYTGFQITPDYNQPGGTNANTDFKINRTQTAVASGAQLFADFQLAGVSKYSVDTSGNLLFSGSIQTNGQAKVGAVIPQGATTLLLYGNGGSAVDRTQVTVQPSGAVTATSGTNICLAILPNYNEASGNASNTDLLVNRTQTAVGSGTQLLSDFQLASTSKWKVDTSGNTTQVGIVNAPAAAFVGTTDRVQLYAQANGTQTANLFELRNSGGSPIVYYNPTPFTGSAGGNYYTFAIKDPTAAYQIASFGAASSTNTFMDIGGVTMLQNISGTMYLGSSATGGTYLGSNNHTVGVGTDPESAAHMTVCSYTAARKVMVLRGVASQSGNLFECQDNSSAVMVSIAANGRFALTNTLQLAPINTTTTPGTVVGQICYSSITGKASEWDGSNWQPLR